MAKLRVWAWKCEVEGCGHEWLAKGEEPPTWCAKCKSRQWNKSESVEATIVAGAVYHALTDKKPGHEEAEAKYVRSLEPFGISRPKHAEGCRCYTCKPPKS